MKYRTLVLFIKKYPYLPPKAVFGRNCQFSESTIGEGSVVGPYASVRFSTVQDNCEFSSLLFEASETSDNIKVEAVYFANNLRVFHESEEDLKTITDSPLSLAAQRAYSTMDKDPLLADAFSLN